MNYKKPNRMVVGPAMPIVPIGDFTPIRNKEILESAWWIVGPSAERNLEQFGIWQTIAAAYLEGVQHGSQLATDGGVE